MIILTIPARGIITTYDHRVLFGSIYYFYGFLSTPEAKLVTIEGPFANLVAKISPLLFQFHPKNYRLFLTFLTLSYFSISCITRTYV